MTTNSKKPIISAAENERGGAAVMLLAILLVLGLSYFAAGNHFVMTEGGMKTYKKEYLTFKDTYVDMRQVGLGDLAGHEPVVKVMVKEGDMALVPGGNALQRMINGGASLSRSIRQIDREFRISDSARQIGRISEEKYRQFDERYDIGGKASAANEKLKEGAKKFNDWLEKQ